RCTLVRCECCSVSRAGASGRDRGILAAECHLRKEDFPRREGNQSTWERWKRQPGQAAARGQFALFDKGRALQAMVSEAQSWEQGARSGRRDSAALSVIGCAGDTPASTGTRLSSIGRIPAGRELNG